jgi:myo-inositol-1(or 4)-monophosphatase
MTLKLLEGLCRAEMKAISELKPHDYSRVIRQGAGGDCTKMIDLVAEEAAVSYLDAAGFRGMLLSEELGVRKFGDADYPLLVLDPVDGTTNAARGISFYSISIAESEGPQLSDVRAGMVVELPSGRVFSAERGKGAFLDGVPFFTAPSINLGEALIGIDLNVVGNREKLMEVVPLCLRVRHSRNLGSAAMGLCYAANGALDLYVDNRGFLRVTDIAAAYIILKEAGGSILDLRGGELDCRLSLVERVALVAGPRKACLESLELMKRIKSFCALEALDKKGILAFLPWCLKWSDYG